jgi:hypothetical protein
MLTKPDGVKLAGNLPSRAIPAGWSTMPALDLGFSDKHAFRTFTGQFDGYRLLVGVSQADVSEISEIALTSFASAAAIVSVLALAGGVVLALRVRRRMQSIAATMSRVSDGELAARKLA